MEKSMNNLQRIAASMVATAALVLGSAGTIYPNSSGAMSSPWGNNIESFKRG